MLCLWPVSTYVVYAVCVVLFVLSVASFFVASGDYVVSVGSVFVVFIVHVLAVLVASVAFNLGRFCCC